MSKIKVAINGFGRIGRLTFRELLKNSNIEVVAINDLTQADVLAHLLKYDTAQGKFDGKVAPDGTALVVNGVTIPVYAEKDPANLPWGQLGVQVVLESTGKFTDDVSAGKHLTAGAKKVVISAPAKGAVPTIVLGVNTEKLTANDHIISNASCTTNCLSPMVKVLNDTFGIEQGFITTIHAYTADQNLQDAPHRDLRRARAAAQSIVPTTTGAASAVGKVIPEMKGKLDGLAVRVPTITGSLTDFNVILKKEATVEAINAAMKAAAETSLVGIMEYQEDPIVSTDIIGSKYSCIFDPALTYASGKMAKVIGWYDNEYGYSTRTAEVIELIGKFC